MTTNQPTPPSAAALPSGEQWSISCDGWEAVVVEVGGSLRSLTREGQPVVAGYDADAKADGARGHVLAPWPNRIRDGRYAVDGVERQLPLTEPARHNASHGLTHWQPWTLLERSVHRLTVGITVHPQPGWDWTLRLETTYALDPDGLTVTARAQNLSASPCPFGWGAHPYLTTGEDTADELTVTAPVAAAIVTDEQLIPTGTTEPDARLRDGLPLADVRLDTGFRVDQPSDGGRWRVRLARTKAPSTATTLWADPAFGYLQLFTGDSLADDRRRRTGVAVEPMTCPADAFNSGDGLITLQPDERWSASFGITR